MDAIPSSIRGRIRRARGYLLGAGLGPFLVRAVAGSGGVRIAAMLASFAVGVQLARGLGVEGYGYYGIALAVITILGIPGELGISKLVTREVAAADAKGDHSKLFGVLRWADRASVRISAAAVLAVVATAAIIWAVRPSPLVLALLLGAPVIPLLGLAKVRSGALQGLSYVVLGQVPPALLRPLLLSLLLFAATVTGIHLGASGAMALNSATAAAALILTHIWLKRRLPKAAPARLMERGRQWLASSVPMALTDGMRVLQSELSILLLALLAAPADAGLFRIAIVTAMIAAAPIPVVGLVAAPFIARLFAQEDPGRLQRLVTYGAYAQFVGVLLLSLPVLIVPELLLSLVFGPDFAGAANALRIVAVGQIANAAFGLNAILLNMCNREQRVTRAMAIALAVNLVSVPLLAAVWGIAGAAAAFVASLLCWNVIAWADARRLLGVETSIVPRWPGQRSRRP